MTSLLFIAVAANYISFFLSVVFIFNRDKNIDIVKYRFFQIVTVSFWIYTMAAIWTHDLPGVVLQQLLFLGAQFVLLVLFWWNVRYVKGVFSLIFSPDEPNFLQSGGLYRWVRHPFYAIYLSTYLLVVLYVKDLISAILFCVLSLIYYIEALAEEKKFIQSDLSEEYQSYRDKTGMFLPKIF